MFRRVRSLLEMIKFSHTVFALPFALLSATLAWQEKPGHWWDVAGLLMCMVFARSAAMAFNRLADRHIDACNPRTTTRHLPSGRLSAFSVWVFTAICAAGFVASTLIFGLSGNPWPFYLSVPVLLFIGAYSYTKRFTILAHFWLGAALALAPVAAWIALCGLEHLLAPITLALAVFCWVAGFDIIYACQDTDFDRRSGLYSIPARLGVRAALRIAGLCHVIMVGFLVGFWAVSPYLGTIYLLGVAAVAGLLSYEHWIVRSDDLSRVNQAFLVVNGVISIGLLGVVWLQLAYNS
jgi:4-hydroxybenzoate polyprenyltransferase